MDKKYFGLLLRKGVYPYEACTSFDCYKATELPTREEFYSQLSMSGVTQEDYQHAKRVWKKFKLKTFGQYTNLYCMTDCLLLQDIVENFRFVCTVPSLSLSYTITLLTLTHYSHYKITQNTQFFRELCQSIYNLDLVNFLTLPALSWNAALKYTQAKLDLLTNTDMVCVTHYFNVM